LKWQRGFGTVKFVEWEYSSDDALLSLIVDACHIAVWQ
jgi:hypothetical protein